MITTAQKRNFIAFTLNVLVLVLYALIVFPLHQDRMYTWLDGSFMRYLALQQHHGMSFFNFGMNILEGLGGITFPLLVNLIPGTWFDLVTSNELHYEVLAYTFFSVQYFIGAYLLCRVFQFSREVSLLAAWVSVLFVMPLLPTYHNGLQLFFAITAISPYLANLIFFCCLLIYSFYQIGRSGWKSTILFSMLSLCIAFYLLFANAASVTIVSPFFIYFFLAFIGMSGTKYELYSKIIFSVLTLALLVLLNYFQFIVGLFLYSIPAIFPEKLSANYPLSALSVLFNDVYSTSKYIVGCGLAGLVVSLFTGSRIQRRFAVLIIGYLGILFAFGISIRMGNWYHGPNPMYFEYMLWPIYFAYAAIFIQFVFFSLVQMSKRLFVDHLSIRPSVTLDSLPPRVTFLILIVIITGSLILNVIYLSNEPENRFAYQRVSPPAIIQYLSRQAALPVGGQFNGFTAGFYPKVEAGKPAVWYQQVEFDQNVLLAKLHYPFRMVGLWDHDIPTLNNYSPLISPALFLLVHNVLSRPIDREIRNVLLFTHPDIPLLQVLGVRYLITNSPLQSEGVRFVMKEDIDQKYGAMYLYEVQNGNLATYSPMKLKPLSDINEFLHLLRTDGIAFRQIAYTDPVERSDFVRPDDVKMYRIKDGVRLMANSRGTSTVLLPVLFSRCLVYQFNGEKPADFNVQRANIAETLIIFNKHIDVNILYQYGLLQHAGCRLKDREELKALVKNMKPIF